MHVLRLVAVLLPLSLAACGGSSTPRVTTAPAPATAAADDPCPVTIPGTSVTVEDTATGAALVFVTTGDVEAVRARVTAWADGHNQRHEAMGPLPTGEEAPGAAAGHDHHAMHGGGGGDTKPAEGHDHHAMHGGGHGGHDAHAGHGGGDGLVGMIGLHSRAKASPIDGGARLELIAFPDQVAAMQEHLRMHAQHLASGSCAMPDHH